MSTFLNEGLAVPHAVMPGLNRVVIAFGIPHAGILESGADKPIELVLMALYPPHLSETYLKLMATMAALIRDRPFQRALSKAENPDEALLLIRASASG